MKTTFSAYLKKNALQLSILAVGILILVALILNLTQGGFWIITGLNGKNAYELAVENGFVGTRQEWLNSLMGTDGQDGTNGINGQNGKSAYEIACENGFVGSIEEWMLSMQFGEKGADGKDGADGLNGKNGKDGKDGTNGKDGVSITSVRINDQGRLIITLSDGSVLDAGYVGASQTPKTDYNLALENGFVGTRHEWLCSYVDGSRADVTVKDITQNDLGELIVTLDDNTTLNAGVIENDGTISSSVDEMGFSQRFEFVVLNHASGALNLRSEPNLNDSSTALFNLPNGTELVCIGEGEVENSDGIFLYYRFLYNGQICYARSKHFTPKTPLES